jgi:methionine-rich copper-binding protein CopC
MSSISMFIRKHIFVLALAILWTMSSVFTVSAHGVEVLKSDPVADSTLDQSPAQVKVWFSEELKTSESTLQVLDSQGNQVDTGISGVDLDDPDHASMKVDLSPLPAGTYVVYWHVVLTDGDASDGQFNFTVGQGSPVQAVYPPPDTSSQKVSAGQSTPSEASYPPPDVAPQKIITITKSQAPKTSTVISGQWLVAGLIGGIVVLFGILGLGISFLRRK